MKLSLKQKALVQVLTVVVSGMFTGLLVVFLFKFFSLQTILIGFGIFGLIYLMVLMYQISLAQLQYKEKLKEMVDDK